MSPDDPRHDSRAGYLAGCRQDCCRIANRRWTKQYRLQAHRNGGRTTVPAEPVRTHVVQLQQTMSLCSIGKASGTSSSQLSRLLQREHPRMRAATATAILAVRADAEVGGHYVSSVGAMRRLQALAVMGYSWEHLERHLGGYGRTNIRMLAYGQRTWITSETATKVKAIYDALWKQVPVGASRVQRGAITKTLRRAQRHGWVGPLAWDDDAIDDPTARPVGLITDVADPAGYDESRIERRILGDRTGRLHKGESEEVVRRMLADGRTSAEIHRLTGIKVERYVKVSELREQVAA